MYKIYFSTMQNELGYPGAPKPLGYELGDELPFRSLSGGVPPDTSEGSETSGPEGVVHDKSSPTAKIENADPQLIERLRKEYGFEKDERIEDYLGSLEKNGRDMYSVPYTYQQTHEITQGSNPVVGLVRLWTGNHQVPLVFDQGTGMADFFRNPSQFVAAFGQYLQAYHQQVEADNAARSQKFYELPGGSSDGKVQKRDMVGWGSGAYTTEDLENTERDIMGHTRRAELESALILRGLADEAQSRGDVMLADQCREIVGKYLE